MTQAPERKAGLRMKGVKIDNEPILGCEGEAHTALPGEGATQAPVIEMRRDTYL